MVRITDRMVSGVSAAMAAGVGARRKSAGVTLLTETSVACAESNTAMHRVNASVWSSGIDGSGYRRSRISPIWSAFSRKAAALFDVRDDPRTGFVTTALSVILTAFFTIFFVDLFMRVRGI